MSLQTLLAVLGGCQNKRNTRAAVSHSRTPRQDSVFGDLSELLNKASSPQLSLHLYRPINSL